ERRYDPDGQLQTAEDARERQRQVRLSAWRRELVEGPALVLPLQATGFQFNPQTLAALDGIGTVYPVLRLTDRWGELQVDGGAALVHADRKRAVVALPPGGDGLRGEGWTLSLKPGWKLVPGERKGDLTLSAPAPCLTTGCAASRRHRALRQLARGHRHDRGAGQQGADHQAGDGEQAAGGDTGPGTQRGAAHAHAQRGGMDIAGRAGGGFVALELV